METSIDNVEVVLLRIPRKRGMAPTENLLVRIHSGDGISGVGACQYESRYGETAAEAALVIQKHYTPLLLNENPLNIETIMAKLDAFMPDHLASKAAIDIALHDLKGKILNVPVYELLGGRARDKVQLLAPQVSRGEPIEQAKEAARLVGEGFKALKLRVGGADVEKDIQRSKKLDRRWVVQLKYELTPTNIILRRQQSASSADWNPLISPGWKTPFQAATSKVSHTCAARFACR